MSERKKKIFIFNINIWIPISTILFKNNGSYKVPSYAKMLVFIKVRDSILGFLTSVFPVQKCEQIIELLYLVNQMVETNELKFGRQVCINKLRLFFFQVSTV